MQRALTWVRDACSLSMDGTQTKNRIKRDRHTQKINVEDVRRGDREYGAGKSQSQVCPAQQRWAEGGKVDTAQGPPDMLGVGGNWRENSGRATEQLPRAGNGRCRAGCRGNGKKSPGRTASPCLLWSQLPCPLHSSRFFLFSTFPP